MKRRAYLLQSGDVTGPFYETELMKRFDSGELLADYQVCEEGKEEWIALGDWLAAASAPPMLLPPALPTNWGIAGGEQPYFQALGIAVTRTRLIVGPQTYAMSGITSVRVDRRPPETTGAIILSVFGALPVLGSLGMLLDPKPREGWNWWGPLLFWFLFGSTLLALGIWIGRQAKPTFLLFVRTSGGEVGVWNSKDAVAIESLNSALNRAIIERG